MRKHIIYLASGSSRRFGGNKLLHLLDRKPMYLHGLTTLLTAIEDCHDCDLTVVSRYASIRETALALGCASVDCPDSEQGISHSIRAGLNALGSVAQEDYILFSVADQPYLTAASVRRLLAQADGHVTGASLCFGERLGNPTLFSARLIPDLLALSDDTGGRAVLRRYPCVFVQADSIRELEDIDVR